MQLNGITLPIFPPPPADPSLGPADALLRESTPGQSQYSPSTQHDKIVELMAKQGHYPACIDGDEERGRVTTRAGYQRIKARVDAGLTNAVYVFHSARLGRDASERIRLQRELKKLRVPIYSVQQGELRADLVGGVYALMDEQFSVDLAFKIKNAMPVAARNGHYLTRTPIGYKRIWPPDQPYARKVAAIMVEDEKYGPLVRDIFGKYGRQGLSIHSIVRWLNSQVSTYPNPYCDSGLWNISLIGRMLRKRAYIGEIEWGKAKKGYYDHYEGPVLRSGVDGCKSARHPALIDDRELWEAVQMRLHNENKRLVGITRKGRTPSLLAGFLVCGRCGQDMMSQGERPTRTFAGQYVCSARHGCRSDCTEPSISMNLADAAVLREVARLQGRFQPQPLDDVLNRDVHAEERRQTEAAIAAARREVDRNVQLLKLVDDPDEETIAAFRRDNKEIAKRITALQAHLSQIPSTTIDAARLEELHALVVAADLAGRIERAVGGGRIDDLRKLLQKTVQRAWICERIDYGHRNHTKWAQADVEWTPEVQLMFDLGRLQQGPAPAPPEPMSRQERARERSRRYRARKREERTDDQEGRVTEIGAAVDVGAAIEDAQQTRCASRERDKPKA